MTASLKGLDRRGFLKGAAGLAGTGALTGLSPRPALAFPDDNLRVTIPTNQGGGADRLARTFTDVWRKSLGTNFEFDFFPGAGGQVGYEHFTNRSITPRDAHHLLFGNMGPEMIMYVLQNPSYKFPDDFFYFCRVDIDDTVLFVRDESPFETIEQLVDEGKRRTLSVAIGRLPHPGSIAMLALGEATGASFNLVPYGGGNPTAMAVLGGETDCGVSTSDVTFQLNLRALGYFAEDSPMAEAMGNPPSVNDVFGTSIPNLYSSRAWAIHTEAAERYPDRYEKLEQTARLVFDDPEYKTLYATTGAPWEAITYGDREACTEYAMTMVELAERYRAMLSGSG